MALSGKGTPLKLHVDYFKTASTLEFFIHVDDTLIPKGYIEYIKCFRIHEIKLYVLNL